MQHVRTWLIIFSGGTLLVLGILLIPVPGPGGVPVAFAGLALLSSKVAWARRLMERLKTKSARQP